MIAENIKYFAEGEHFEGVYDIVSIDFKKNQVKIFDPKGKKTHLIDYIDDDGYFINTTGLKDKNGIPLWEGDFIAIFYIEGPVIENRSDLCLEEILDIYYENSKNAKEVYELFQIEKQNEQFIVVSLEDDFFETPIYDYSEDNLICHNIVKLADLTEYRTYLKRKEN